MDLEKLKKDITKKSEFIINSFKAVGFANRSTYWLHSPTGPIRLNLCWKNEISMTRSDECEYYI